MFNATTARQTADDIFEAGTDLFAANFEDRLNGLPISRRQTAIDRFGEVVSDDEAFNAFVDGTTTPQSGLPALGTGQQPPTNEQEALAFLLNSGSLPSGVKHALKRLLNPQDPAHIRVGADGTPEEVSNLRQQVADLGRQLAAERATAAALVRKDAVKAKADEAKTKMAATKTAYGDRTAKDAAMAAIEEVISLVS